MYLAQRGPSRVLERNIRTMKLLERQTSTKARSINVTATRLLLARLEINDPLAHIIQAEQNNTEIRTTQAEQEFDTGMQERNPEGFYSTEMYSDVGDDFISSQGMSMRTMLDNSVHAAKVRHQQGDYPWYGVETDIQRRREYDHLRSWKDQGAPGRLMVQSLCPSSNELPHQQAEAMGYDQHKLRSSISVYQMNNLGEIEGYFFSIDQHTLDSNKSVLDGLGIVPSKQIDSTICLLGQAFIYHPKDPNSSPRDEVLALHGSENKSVELNQRLLAESRDEWFDLSEVVRDCLQAGRYSADYLAYVARYDLPMEGPPTIEWSTHVMDLYRSRIAPHKLFAQANEPGSSSTSTSVVSLPSYGGACPSSTTTLGLGAESFSAVNIADISQLQHRYAGHGGCQACGVRGSLYGCGAFCRSCNNVWCWEYKETNRMLSYQEVNKARRSFKYRWIH